MDKEELKELLKKANLSKKEYWVKSWLENYIMKQKHEQMLEIMKDSGVCE